MKVKKHKTLEMSIAYINKMLGIRSPSTMCHGYEFYYDYLKAKKGEKK